MARVDIEGFLGQRDVAARVRAVIPPAVHASADRVGGLLRLDYRMVGPVPRLRSETTEGCGFFQKLVGTR
jgi:hypothetical protein